MSHWANELYDDNSGFHFCKTIYEKFPEIFGDPEAEVEGILKLLAPDPESVFFDLGGGIGRHDRLLMKDGHYVIVQDPSPSLRRDLENWALVESLKSKLTYYEMAAPKIPISIEADFVISINGPFGYFDRQADEQILAGLFKSLKPGGGLLIKTVNIDYEYNSQINYFSSLSCEDSLLFYSTLLAGNQVINHYLHLDDNTGNIIWQGAESIQGYSQKDLRFLLLKTGFSDIKFFSELGRNPKPFSPDSRHLVVVAKKE